MWWIKSVYSTLGASNHSEYDRADNDFYATDPVVIWELFDKMKEHNETFADVIREPATWNWHLAEELKKRRHGVMCTDIIQREYKLNRVHDFLLDASNWTLKDTTMDIITNPPYKYAQAFVEKAISLLNTDRKVAFFLKLTFLEWQKRKKMFKDYPPKYVFVYSKRAKCARNWEEEMFDKSSAVCYAWFVWVKWYKGNPIIDRI